MGMQGAGLAMGVVVLAGCSSEVVTMDASSTSADTTTAGSTGAATSSGSSGQGGAQNHASAEVLRQFDAAAGQLADGVAARGQEIFVSFAVTGEILRLDLVSGADQAFGLVPATPLQPSQGLAVDAMGAVYAGSVSKCGTPDGIVYGFSTSGGAPSASWVGPAVNAIAFADTGAVFLADPGGRVHTIDPMGGIAVWSVDPLLIGGAQNCPNAVTGYDVGASGVAIIGDSVYVTNANRGTVLRIPIHADGSAGAAEIVAGPDCGGLGGADGIVAVGATLYVAVKASDRVVALDTLTGILTDVFGGPPLEAPDAIAVASDGSLLVTNADYDWVSNASPSGGCSLCGCASFTGPTSTLVRITLP